MASCTGAETFFTSAPFCRGRSAPRKRFRACARAACRKRTRADLVAFLKTAGAPDADPIAKAPLGVSNPAVSLPRIWKMQSPAASTVEGFEKLHRVDAAAAAQPYTCFAVS